MPAVEWHLRCRGYGMTSIRGQAAGDIHPGAKNGKKPFERMRGELQRNDPLLGNLDTVLSGIGSQDRNRWTHATCRYRIGEHGPASLAECRVRLLTPSCPRRQRRKQQQVCDRL